MEEPAAANRSRSQIVGLIGGPVLLVITLAAPAPDGLSDPAWLVAGIGMLMAVWWVTEAIPIPATALLPIVLFPALGILDVKSAAAPYAHPLIFLFLGGFMIALAMQRCGLHRRLALRVMRMAGTRGSRLIAGFLCATAFLSMWVSNTATALMMFPIATSVIDLLETRAPKPDATRGGFPLALMLAVAYGANIGGMGTLIGTPPNALLAAFLEESYQIQIGFAEWMVIGVPTVAGGLVLAWLILRRAAGTDAASSEDAASVIDAELGRLGPLSDAERAVAAVFILTAAAWILQPFLARYVPGITDTGIALAAGLVLFLITARMRPDWAAAREPLLDWASAERLPWGVLLLFGGGLSLAEAVTATGLAEAIGGGAAALGGVPLPLLALLIALIVLFLTELTSNTATTAAFLPVVAAAAVGLGHGPVALCTAAALAASAAFMLPVATPPNAVVFGSGRVPLASMARVGWLMNLGFAIVVPAAAIAAAKLFS